jgi:hypothetical protein
VDPVDVEQIIAGWPGPQQNVARQLLAKYGPPNEAGCSGTTTGPGRGPS